MFRKPSMPKAAISCHRWLWIVVVCLSTTVVTAEEVKVGIAEGTASMMVETSDGPLEIKRIQDQEHRLTGEFSLTSRACPPFCIQPMSPADGVTTIGELELLEMLTNPEAVVIDSRTIDWYDDGSIPGAVHIPYNVMTERLDQLGCEIDFDGWDCSDAKNVALFCNGLWCGQSPTAIRAIIAAGYPPERIFYYRGGMQSWSSLGLSTTAETD